jgi:hypothetical protein
MRSLQIEFFAAIVLIAACGSDDAARKTSGAGGGAGSYGSGGTTSYGTGGTTSYGTGGTTSYGTGGFAGLGGSTSATFGGSAGVSGGAGSTSVSATGGVALTGGYYTSGAYKGYFYTAAGIGSSITPPCGTGACFTTSACVAGTVGKVSSATAYSAEWGALVGWNIAQEAAPPNPANGIAIDGKTIKLSLAPGSPLPSGMRVKVAVAGVEYCTDLTGATASVPVSSLKKECWTAGGASLPAGSQIAAVAIQVTSDAMSDKRFDFCVSALSIE